MSVNKVIKELWLSEKKQVESDTICLGNVRRNYTSASGKSNWNVMLFDYSKGGIEPFESFTSVAKKGSLEILESKNGSYCLVDWSEIEDGVQLIGSVSENYAVDKSYISDINNFPLIKEYIKTKDYGEVSSYAKKVYRHSIFDTNVDKEYKDLMDKAIKELYLEGIDDITTISIGSFVRKRQGTTNRLLLFDASKTDITTLFNFETKSEDGLCILKSGKGIGYALIDWSVLENQIEYAGEVVDSGYNLDKSYVTNLSNFLVIKQYLYNEENYNSIVEFKRKTDKLYYHSVFTNSNDNINKANKIIKELWLSDEVAKINTVSLGLIRKNQGEDNQWWIGLYNNSQTGDSLIERFDSINKNDSLELIQGNKGSYILIDWKEVSDGSFISSVSDTYQLNIDYVSDINNFPIIKLHIQAGIDWENKYVEKYNKPAISWVDDDFVLDAVPKVKELCDELGCKCDFALVPDSTGGNNIDYDAIYSISEEKLQLAKSYELDGFHVEIHPPHYGWYVSAGAGGKYEGRKWVENSLVKTINVFKDNNILNSSCIIYPGTSGTENEAIQMVSCWLDYGINAGGSSEYNDGICNKFSLNRLFIGFSQKHTKTWYKNIIDEAYAKGAWLILGTHSYSFDDSGTIDETTNSFANLKEIIQYANSKVTIEPISQVFRRRKPMLDLFIE